ncbi:MAG: TRAP transporter substrate-binding protein DctP [Paracoccaceae bacterium]
MTRWFIVIATAVVLTAATAAPAGTVIKIGSLAPTGSSYHDILLDLQRDWAEISDGAVELRIYGGGTVGDESDIVRKMRIGQLHAAILTSGGLPDIDPDFRAFQVPMMFGDIAEFDHVMREMRPTLDGLLAKHGFRGLGWADAGWLHFFSRRPIMVPDDLRPQRIFVWAGADRFVKAWRDCGFRPIQLPATEIHTALQSQMIDAISAPPLAALSSQWFAQIPHMSTLRWVPLMGSLVITERAWRKLPKRLRSKLAEAAERAATRLRTEVRGDSEEAIRIMQDYGLTVHEVAAPDIETWRVEVRKCFGPMIGSYINARLIGEIEETLDAYRASN